MKHSFLIFISRSGSTVFARMLAEHAPGLLVLPEFNLLPLLLSYGDDYVRTMTPKELMKALEDDPQIDNLGLDRETIKEILLGEAPNGIRSLADKIVKAYAVSICCDEYTHVLFQRGSYLKYTKEITDIFPGASFIHIYRDPRGSISSMLRTYTPYRRNQLMGRGDVYYLAHSMKEYFRRVERIRSSDILPFFEVRYEAFCEDADLFVRKAIEFLGTEYSESVLDGRFNVGQRESGIHSMIKLQPQTKRIDAWKQEFPAWKGVPVERILERDLNAYNYELWFIYDRSWLFRQASMVMVYIDHLRRTTIFYLKRLIYNEPPWRLTALRRKLY